MFGQNEIVGRKYFKDAPDDQLFVTSIFFTLQGEGPYMGHPAVFVRLAKCNLACSFCDTYFDHGEWMTFAEINDKANEVIFAHFVSLGMEPPEWAFRAQSNVDHPFDHPSIMMVITGGEPTLQPALLSFLIYQSMQWLECQIETNGTQQLEDLVDYCVVVLSPKCVEINGKADHYMNLNTGTVNLAHYLKFVVSADPDSPYHDIPDWAKVWANTNGHHRVYISPMNVYQTQPQQMKMSIVRDGIPDLASRNLLEKASFWEPGLLNLEANRANHEYAAKFCLKYGMLLNLQMHLYCSVA
jgi:organic radical activating enzyme